jgi:hypothetical protein
MVIILWSAPRKKAHPSLPNPKQILPGPVPFPVAFSPFLTQLSRTMKCSVHQHEALAICTYCGRALCADCVRTAPSQRLICSDACAAALSRNDRALTLLLQKSRQSARANAFYSFLCGGLSAAGAVGAAVYLPVPFLVWFCAGCSLVFLASGTWFGWIAKKSSDGD